MRERENKTHHEKKNTRLLIYITDKGRIMLLGKISIGQTLISCNMWDILLPF